MQTQSTYPVLPVSPIPHRKIIRSWLSPVAKHNTFLALLLVAVDVLLFGLAIVATVWFQHFAVKLCFSLIEGFIIGRLFILGHDACHQSLTTHRRLNRWIGRIVFLPSLTPYSLWDIGHNMVHHGYTNLKGVDFVWQPKSMEEFQILSPWRQKLERLYRSGWAPGLYYMIEIWWKRMYFPSRRQMPTRRAVFVLDGLLVTAAAVCWIVGLTLSAMATGQSVLLLLLTGLVVPFLFWNAMIGFVVYVHHTHVDIAWYEDKKAWAAAQPFVSTTVHLTFRYRVGALLHHIMEHTAHHVDMSVPLYRLKTAQKILETRLPGCIVIQNFSWRWYFETVKRCKLYDFKRRCWMDFSGKSTSDQTDGGES